ncbi:MAG: hypothetical protein J6X02_01865 [Bacilli bacterium]|nr:hypothetical protein [Bacilli bacterium]
MNKWIKRIIYIMVLLGVGFLVTYGSYYFSKKYVKDAEVKVTFEDSKSYVIPEVTEMSEEEALKEWPYIMHFENVGKREAKFDLVIKDVDGDIKRENLSYALFLNDKKVESGELSKIKKNVFYSGSIKAKDIQDYKLYVWVNKKSTGTKYEYSLNLNFTK